MGQDTIADDVNFNSNETSEYAIKRMNLISEATSEPFMMFEFMKVIEKNNQEEAAVRDAMHSYIEAADINEQTKYIK